MSEIAGVMAAAADVQAFCRDAGWRFCFIGGIAVQRWGMPRFTQDVDLTLLTGWGAESAYIDALLQRFPARLRDARQFALEHRVVLARTTTGVDLDVALGALPFEEMAVDRASLWQVNKTTALMTCSAEDLIVHKVFAGRERDWADVETILARRLGKLDLAHIRHHLPPLLELKDDTTSMPALEQRIAAVAERNGH